MQKKNKQKFAKILIVRLNIQMSLATQIQDVTNSLRMNQKKLFDYVKKYNSIEGGEFLRLSEEKMLEMKDTEIEDNKNELELMEELAQDRFLDNFIFLIFPSFFYKIKKFACLEQKFCDKLYLKG